MFVKLHYTSNQSIQTGLRLLTQIVNDQTVVNTATFVTSYTNAQAHSDLTTGLDIYNSQIIRTNTATNTTAHFAGGTATYSYVAFTFTLAQPVYDNTSTIVYTQILDATSGAAPSTNYAIATQISSGSMSTSTCKSLAVSNTTAGGTPVVTGGTYRYISSTHLAGSISILAASTNAIRTFWFYINNQCFVFCATITTSYPLGFGPTYNSNLAFIGPYYFGQYTRYDYHNTDANGVVPVMFTSARTTNGAGFGAAGDYGQAHNATVTLTSDASPPFRVYNLVSALPQVGSSWPLVAAPYVNWGVGSRFDEIYALTASQAGNSASFSTTYVPYGAGIFTTVGTRFPSATLQSTAYAMLPILWRNTYYGNTGGNSSAQTGVYIFNGDYWPGDEFVYGSKTYKIWPLFNNFSDRVGLAIPKE